MRQRVASLGMAVSIALILAGCMAAGPTPSVPVETPAASPSADGTTSLPGTSWLVVTIGGTATLPDSRPTIVFGGDGQVQGTGGCNGYGAPYRVDGDAIEVGDVVSTMMLCEGEELGAQEGTFQAALRGARTWRITAEGDLELSGVSVIVASPGQPDASADPVDPPVGLDGDWDLVEMGPTADFAHLLPTISFGAVGTVSGFAACNTFHGNYRTDGATLSLGPLASTKIGCPRPASAVESEYLNALSGVVGWVLEPDGRLRLDGPVPLRYTRR